MDNVPHVYWQVSYADTCPEGAPIIDSYPRRYNNVNDMLACPEAIKNIAKHYVEGEEQCFLSAFITAPGMPSANICDLDPRTLKLLT